ncbi:MAG: biotin--[acetyl-CoA-carboxylase] ligase [Gammaproteobacteria bacterium]|nr:biotin--[acetyl-CoA-carboxylase] ligase [Gammaproteobacteria bacterium]
MSFEEALRVLADGKETSLRELGIDNAELDEFTAWLDSLDLLFETDGETVAIPAGIDLLDGQTIQSLMSPECSSRLKNIEVFLEIDSTNSYLYKKSLTGESGILCLAERQTAGRGRRGRNWVSPFGGNLYMSILWRMPLSGAPIEGLSLAIGVAIVRALRSEGFSGIKMKWPNDLLLDGGKIAGILIEMKPPTKDFVDLVIGVGINLSMPVNSAKMIDQPWQDLSDGMKSKSRNGIAATLVTSIVDVLTEYPQLGFVGFESEWHALDAYHNKLVELHLGHKIVKGYAQGVNSEGAIKILVDGELHCFHGGEISLRLADDSRS